VAEAPSFQPEYDAPPDPRDHDAFRRWLETKPREWSVVIAARAALRVLPLVRTTKASATLLPVFRATAIARFAAVYPNRGIEAADAARAAAYAFRAYALADAADAARAAADNAARAAASAFDTADVARAAASAFDAASVAARAASVAARAASAAAYAAVTTTTRQDALALKNRAPAERLARTALWQPGEGMEAYRNSFEPRWTGLRSDLISLGKHWKVWTDWYDELLGGSLPSLENSEAWEAAFTDVQHPSDPWEGPLPWDDGPEAVNLAIKARLDKLQASAALDVVERVIDDRLEASRTPDPLPLEGISSPVAIVRRPDGRITAEAGALHFQSYRHR